VALTRTVLVLRALGLGDLLTSVPALRAIRRGLPEHELVLAGPASVGRLLERSDVVDRVVPTGDLMAIDWGEPPPDVAVNLHGSGPQSHRLLLSLQPARVVGFGCPDVGFAGPVWQPGEHEVRRWCRLVGDAGWPAHPSELHLPRPDAASRARGAVVIHPGAAHRARRWPVDRYAAVARWARSQGHTVVVTGSGAEVPLARRLACLADLPDGTVMAGSTDIADLAALVAQARLVVCGDTGVAHLASAFATPSVVLFGPVPPSEWGPPREGPHTIVWHDVERTGAATRGDPFGDHVDPALLAISVEEVEAAMRERLTGDTHPRTSSDAATHR
jgi:ADP-heptose:LPS heptosyltransferase